MYYDIQCVQILNTGQSVAPILLAGDGDFVFDLVLTVAVLRVNEVLETFEFKFSQSLFVRVFEDFLYSKQNH